jgi:AcrR family transcriptional regulator
VLEGAARVFERVGFAQASLADIARESGATTGSVYFYFPSKEDMALAIIGEQNDRTLKAVAPGEGSVLEQLVRASKDVADQILTDPLVRAGMRLSLEQGILSAPTAQFYTTWMDAVSQALGAAAQDGEITDAIPLAELGRTLITYFTGVQLVSNVLDDRKSLYSSLAVMWKIILPAIAAEEFRPRMVSLAEGLFSGPQPADGSALPAASK